MHEAFGGCEEFARSHTDWLLPEGEYGCSKSYLAAAIGNYCIALGGEAVLVEVSALFDYLRQSFRLNMSYFEQFNQGKS